jgi:hypothetical protein
MIRLTGFVFLSIVLLASCRTGDEAARVLDRAIEAHGMNALDHAVVRFEFRGDRFEVQRDGDVFQYERRHDTADGRTVDIVTGQGLVRRVNNVEVNLQGDAHESALATVRSVIFFALLPYSLRESPVRLRLLDEVEIMSESYHTLEAVFQRDGGLRDWEGRYILWIHRTAHTVDFFAYEFVGDDGGTRFREVAAVREVDGIRFQDYRNYVDEAIDRNLLLYPQRFSTRHIQLVSEVRMRNIEVERLR